MSEDNADQQKNNNEFTVRKRPLQEFAMKFGAEGKVDSRETVSGGIWNQEKRTYTVPVKETNGIFTEYKIGRAETATGGGDPRVYERHYKREALPNGKTKETEVVLRKNEWVKAGPMEKFASFHGFNNWWTAGHLEQTPPSEPGKQTQFELHLKVIKHPFRGSFPGPMR